MKVRVLPLLFTLSLFAFAAEAHDARPIFVQVIEKADETGDANGSVELRWRVPKLRAAIPAPIVELSETCRPISARSEINSRDSRRFERHYSCADGLDGRVLMVQYPGANPAISTLVRIERASGEIYSRLLPPDELSYEIPATRTTLQVARDYTELGVRHILKGADHLLFVACLLMLARTWKRTLVTITGFTIAHSITLALSTLSLVRLPIAPVEATIALSIVFVARELALGKTESLTARYPVSVSSSFGLLHGFGFASVLREIGLPSNEVPAALFSFNVGVELGQILFVAALWPLLLALARFLPTATNNTGARAVPFALEKTVVYAIGALAVFWTIDRILVF